MQIEPFFLNAYLPPSNPRENAAAYWRRLVDFLKEARKFSPLLEQWHLQARNRRRALKSQVFGNEQHCLEELLKTKDFRSAEQNEVFGYSFGLWNGNEELERGLSLSAALGWKERNFISFSLPYQCGPESASLFDTKNLLELIRLVEHHWSPYWLAVISDEYQEKHALFSGRRGVGWIAYARTRIEKRAIPEAAGMEYMNHGTAIITTHEVFSSGNPLHVNKANQIEARLADLGILPKQ
jgi:hypothetical protein